MSSYLQARRATLDDLATLRALWETMRYPVAELERQLTEFQVVVDVAGTVVGTIGMRTAQKQGQIHSEAYSDFSVAGRARPVFWERLQSLSTNHGLIRLWICDSSPFWTQTGFQPATPAELEKLPEPWDRATPGWLSLQLKDENAVASLDKEFAMFVASEKQRSEQALGQARVLKTIVTIFAIVLAVGIFAAGLYIFLARRGSLPPP